MPPCPSTIHKFTRILLAALRMLLLRSGNPNLVGPTLYTTTPTHPWQELGHVSKIASSQLSHPTTYTLHRQCGAETGHLASMPPTTPPLTVDALQMRPLHGTDLDKVIKSRILYQPSEPKPDHSKRPLQDIQHVCPLAEDQRPVPFLLQLR
jgi:hypothetical protein